MGYLPEKPRHQRVLQWVVGSIVHVGHDLLFRLFFSATKSELQELRSASLFGRLLLKNILEQIAIALNQPLTVTLSVLDLLLAIALDPLHQRLHGSVLFRPQSAAFAFHRLHDALFVVGDLMHFLLVGLETHVLSIVVLLDAEKYFFLVA